MPTFHSHFTVQAPLDKVLAFHRDARNLPKVQPPFPKVLSLICPPELSVGSLVEVELGPFPRQSWKVRVDELHEPHGEPRRALMIDTMISGPFPFWRHRHEFTAHVDATLIEDTIDFEPPGGRFGWLLLPGVTIVLTLMFCYRRKQTRNHLNI